MTYFALGPCWKCKCIVSTCVLAVHLPLFLSGETRTKQNILFKVIFVTKGSCHCEQSLLNRNKSSFTNARKAMLFSHVAHSFS